MATGARITLTSPDPSSTFNAHADIEHTNTIASDSDTVTFIAQDISNTSADPISSGSPKKADESSASTQAQRAEISIESVVPYDVVDDASNAEHSHSDDSESKAARKIDEL